MQPDEAVHTKDRLTGTWKLISVASTTQAGERDEAPYGANPVGRLTYSNGRVSAMISYDGRKPLSIGAGTEEQAEAFKTFLAYAGRYTLLGDKVTHFVEIASLQNWVGKDLVRYIRFEDNRITLVTPPTPSNGKLQTFELVWQRLPID